MKASVVTQIRFLLRGPLAKIHPVDRSLMAFMAVLLLQSAYSLFVPPASGEVAGDIDIIIRTSSAAIFGYFLSANFVRRPSSPAESCETPPPMERPLAPSPAWEAYGTAQPERPGADSGALPQKNTQEKPPASNCLQVAAATGIGLFCLLTLLVLRNTPLGNAALTAQPDRLTATVAQFRDFVSGCVGFLIGCPTHPATPQS